MSDKPLNTPSVAHEMSQHIAQFSAWLAGTEITLLEWQSPTGTLRLEREPDAGGAGQLRVSGEAAAIMPLRAAVVPPAPAGFELRAKALGVYLDRHPLQAQPFTAPGQTVHAGQTVALLQVGALLQPVVATQAGVVQAQPVAVGSTVSYGQTLLRLAPLPAEDSSTALTTQELTP
jgi:acetyl-CoA carboxylase biotin carboxyl carrier protein